MDTGCCHVAQPYGLSFPVMSNVWKGSIDTVFNMGWGGQCKEGREITGRKDVSASAESLAKRWKIPGESLEIPSATLPVSPTPQLQARLGPGFLSPMATSVVPSLGYWLSISFTIWIPRLSLGQMYQPPWGRTQAAPVTAVCS